MSGNYPEKEAKLPERYRLGEFNFLLETHELRDALGNIVHLRSQSADVLAQLVRCYGQVVSKTVLFESVWAGSVVTDDSLVQCITDIRRALNDRDHKIIQTSSKKGYKALAVPIPSEPDSIILPLPPLPSIAVLAFDDFSVGDDSDYLSDAIAEGVIAELSRFPELFVIARNSSFSFRETPTNVKTISRKLGVRYLLEGSQQKNGNRMRVTVQLIDAVEGHHLWSEVYDRNLSDLFVVQDDIVRKVVAAVAQKVINFEVKKAVESDSSKLTALLHGLKARLHFVKLSPEENEKARKASLAAINADPTQPYGYIGLAFAYINGYRWGWTDLSRADALIEAQKAAKKAVELAPDYYDSHAAMAYVHLQENNLDGAVARAQRVLELNPNDTNGMSDLAEFLGYAGRFDEAEELLLRAMRLDPLHPDWFKWNLAWVQWLKGNCKDALQTMNAMSEIPPMAYRVLACIHICLGQQNEAREAVRRLVELDPEYSIKKVRDNYLGKFRNDADLERVLNNLREAGLPD